MRVAVVGATGYAGLMLLKLLSRHSEFELVSAVSEHAAGHPLAEFIPPHPRLPDSLMAPEAFEQLAAPDLVFFALGAGEGMERIRSQVAKGSRVIDLAASFRFRDLGQYERFYGSHPDVELHHNSFTGYADDDALVYPRDRALLGNPGCYPTAFAVAVQPLVRRFGPLGYVLVDGKSGVSGAGRSPRTQLLMGEMAENVEAYNEPGRHRHTGEMETVSQGTVVFQPHLMPMRQGILLTIYVPSGLAKADAIRRTWRETYAANPFVVVRDAGQKPRTANVRDTNLVELAVSEDEATGTVVIYSAIDNLVKGAAGQAIQHANRWFGFDGTRGLL